MGLRLVVALVGDRRGTGGTRDAYGAAVAADGRGRRDRRHLSGAGIDPLHLEFNPGIGSLHYVNGLGGRRRETVLKDAYGNLAWRRGNAQLAARGVLFLLFVIDENAHVILGG